MADHGQVNSDAYVDEEMEPDPHLNELTNLIIGAAIEVHRTLGPGFLESVYEEALAIEFRLRSIPFARQVEFIVVYKNTPVGKGRVDFLVGGLVLVDLKAIEQLALLHSAQMISYLSASGHPLGLFINFNVRRLVDGVRRIAGRSRIGR